MKITEHKYIEDIIIRVHTNLPANLRAVTDHAVARCSGTAVVCGPGAGDTGGLGWPPLRSPLPALSARLNQPQASRGPLKSFVTKIWP